MERPDLLATVVLVRRGAELSCWPLHSGSRPDLRVVDELARTSLGARRLGCTIRLRDAHPELVDLLALVGLAEVVGLAGEVVRQPEGGEEVRSEEVVVPDDPVP
jgi:hypothetical protein